MCKEEWERQWALKKSEKITALMRPGGTESKKYLTCDITTT